VIFEADYDKIKLQKSSYDIISVMSHHCIIKKRHQNNFTKIFSNLGPSQSKFLATPVVLD